MSDQQNLVGQHRAQRAALADFGSFAFQCDDLDALLSKAVELVSEAMDIDLVKILEHLPERRELLIRCGVNWQPGVVNHVTFADHQHSPGGYALQTSEPVVSPDVDAETRFEIPEVLVRHGVKSMVNVIIAGADRPFGVLEVDAREKRDFGDDAVDFLRNYANLLATAIDRLRLHAKLDDKAREQVLLTQELRHRVKNLLGVVKALVSQTSEDGRSAHDFKASVVGRLQAFAAAEDAVFDDGSNAADVGRVARAVLSPFRDDRPEALVLQGDRLLVPARTARMLGLALHELATNAAKYGALSAPAGQVRLRWRNDGEEVTIVWSERGGPMVVSPERRGFGTRLLKEILPAEVHGASELTNDSEGLEFRLTIPATEFGL